MYIGIFDKLTGELIFSHNENKNTVKKTVESAITKALQKIIDKLKGNK